MSTPTSSAPPINRGSRSIPTRRSERIALANVHAHLSDVEKWFIKRGLPHFIEDYRATDDVFNRALPLIVLLIIVQMGLELSSHTVTWQKRGIGAAVGLGAVLVLFLTANLIRQRHAWYKWPKKVGVIEISLLVALGPAVGLVARASYQAVAADLAANIAVLIVVYALVAYAVLPVILWALRHSVKEVSNLVSLASKALPMLALFGTFLFLNVDMWHIASFLERQQLWTMVGFFAVITFLFLMVRLPEEVRSLSGLYTKASVLSAATDTPLIKHLHELDDDLHPISPNRKQRINMLFVLAFTQIVQVLLLSLVVFAYFVTLGKLAVTNTQVSDWLNIPECEARYGSELYREELAKCASPGGWAKIVEPGKWFGLEAKLPFHYLGYHDVVFSEPLLQTAILLTTFSAFFFAVSAVTDEAYRKDFFESITGTLIKSLELRCGYVNLYIKAAKGVGPGAGLARDGIGYDFHAAAEDHRRTLHVPIHTADPILTADPDHQPPPEFPADSFQPPLPQQHYQQGPNQFPNQFPNQPTPGSGAPQQGPLIQQRAAPRDDDPFQRWPQQQ